MLVFLCWCRLENEFGNWTGLGSRMLTLDTLTGIREWNRYMGACIAAQGVIISDEFWSSLLRKIPG